jgi:hypothetical protein
LIRSAKFLRFRTISGENLPISKLYELLFLLIVQLNFFLHHPVASFWENYLIRFNVRRQAIAGYLLMSIWGVLPLGKDEYVDEPSPIADLTGGLFFVKVRRTQIRSVGIA